MIHTYLPSPDEVDAQRREYLPKLREFESQCRTFVPLPSIDDLTTADSCRFHTYLKKMANFKPYSPFTESCVGILHSDLVGLLAAEKAFRSVRTSLVLLTPEERKRWFETYPDLELVGGWYWFLFWKIHTKLPERFQGHLSHDSIDPGAVPWIITHGRGSSAKHELWSYNGSETKLIDPKFAAVVAEHGPIEEWFE